MFSHSSGLAPELALPLSCPDSRVTPGDWFGLSSHFSAEELTKQEWLLRTRQLLEIQFRAFLALDSTDDHQGE